jgi:beta-lactamase class A
VPYPYLAFLVLTVAPADDLADRLRPLIAAHRGEVAVAVKHLGNGVNFYHRADEPMPTASLIKVAVMAEAYQQAHDGKIRLSDPVTLRKEDKVPGSGVLTDNFSDGVTFPLLDAVRLMISVSDNTATNLVLDRIGLGATAARMEAWGFPNTRLHAKVFRRDTSLSPERSERFGLGSTTAREMVGLLEKLHRGELVSAEASKAMLGHLKKCDDRDKLVRFLPPGTVVAHKTGSVSDARTDAGLIYLPGGGAVAVCVLTAKNEDRTWRVDNAAQVLIAQVAKEVYEHCTRQP